MYRLSLLNLYSAADYQKATYLIMLLIILYETKGSHSNWIYNKCQKAVKRPEAGKTGRKSGYWTGIAFPNGEKDSYPQI